MGRVTNAGRRWRVWHLMAAPVRLNYGSTAFQEREQRWFVRRSTDGFEVLVREDCVAVGRRGWHGKKCIVSEMLNKRSNAAQFLDDLTFTRGMEDVGFSPSGRPEHKMLHGPFSDPNCASTGRRWGLCFSMEATILPKTISTNLSSC